MRVGDYRVIYEIDDGNLVVLVIRIRHRQSVYDKHWFGGDVFRTVWKKGDGGQGE
ncbi:MAG: hypothetical protein ACJAQT_000375 [Akkermansiaceae bacterium]|jgi:hypothetical protein